MLTQKRLKELLEYNFETGIFIWIAKRHGTERSKIAGCKDINGYIKIGIDYKDYLAHRLAWLYVHGHFPKSILDHIDRNTSNNLISNLREVSRIENGQNSIKPRKNNTSGFLGVVVFKNRKKKFNARIIVNGKNKNLGYYYTPEVAHQAYMLAKQKYHISF